MTKKVRCVDNDDGTCDLTIGKVYDVISEGGIYYNVKNDANMEVYYKKNRFDVQYEKDGVKMTKVICMDNDGVSSFLTVGEIYEAADNGWGYVVTDTTGEKNPYDKARFDIVKEDKASIYVKCINNDGMEDILDVGGYYVVSYNDDNVYHIAIEKAIEEDGYAELYAFFKNRFEEVDIIKKAICTSEIDGLDVIKLGEEYDVLKEYTNIDFNLTAYYIYSHNTKKFAWVNKIRFKDYMVEDEKEDKLNIRDIFANAKSGETYIGNGFKIKFEDECVVLGSESYNFVVGYDGFVKEKEDKFSIVDFSTAISLWKSGKEVESVVSGTTLEEYQDDYTLLELTPVEIVGDWKVYDNE